MPKQLVMQLPWNVHATSCTRLSIHLNTLHNWKRHGPRPSWNFHETVSAGVHETLHGLLMKPHDTLNGLISYGTLKQMPNKSVMRLEWNMVHATVRITATSSARSCSWGRRGSRSGGQSSSNQTPAQIKSWCQQNLALIGKLWFSGWLTPTHSGVSQPEKHLGLSSCMCSSQISWRWSL